MKKIFLSLFSLISFSFSSEDCFKFFNDQNFQQASSCFIDLSNKKPTADNFFFVGSSFLSQNKYKEALVYFKKAESIEKRQTELSSLYNRLAVVYSHLGNKDLELSYNLKYLHLNLKLKNKHALALAYSNLGSYYSNVFDYNKSIEAYNNSLKYKDDKDKSIVFNNLALVYQDMNNFEKSSEFYNKAISNSISFKQNNILCISKVNLATLFFYKQDFDLAEKSLLEALPICEESNFISSKANAFIYLGFISLKQNKYSLAKEYYYKAKPLAFNSGSKTILTNLDKLYLEINPGEKINNGDNKQ